MTKTVIFERPRVKHREFLGPGRRTDAARRNEPRTGIPGGKFAPDELRMLASAMAPALGAGPGSGSVTQVAGIDTIRLDSDKGLFELSMIPCGVRHVAIASGGASGTEILHRQILESFACHFSGAFGLIHLAPLS